MTGDTDWRRAFNSDEICDPIPIVVGRFSETNSEASIVRRRARLDGDVDSISCGVLALARRMLIFPGSASQRLPQLLGGGYVETVKLDPAGACWRWKLVTVVKANRDLNRKWCKGTKFNGSQVASTFHSLLLRLPTNIE